MLSFSAGFASIDWILSLEPKFWSAVFIYTQGASWFNTGMAIVFLTVALFSLSAGGRRHHMVDLSQILLATTIFWAYVEFMQFLIIWEENLKTEIPWYLKRLDSVWYPAILCFRRAWLHRAVLRAFVVAEQAQSLRRRHRLRLHPDQPARPYLGSSTCRSFGADAVLARRCGDRGLGRRHGPAVCFPLALRAPRGVCRRSDLNDGSWLTRSIIIAKQQGAHCGA